MQQTAVDPRSVNRPKSSTDMVGFEPERGAWYRLSTNILLAVIFLPPIGLFFAWRYADWPATAKVAATAWTLLVLYLVVLFTLSLGPSTFAPVPHAP
jgi:hypothetical protein